MDGPGVFKFAVKMLAKIADEVISEAGYTPDQIDWLVPHQANKRIIDATAKQIAAILLMGSLIAAAYTLLKD